MLTRCVVDLNYLPYDYINQCAYSGKPQGSEGGRAGRPALLLSRLAAVNKVFKEVSDKQRWLMLSDDSMPDETFDVIGYEDKEKYIQLRLRNVVGDEFLCACFDRDVRLCVKEWGVNPMQWKKIYPYKRVGQSRYAWLPWLEKVEVTNIGD